MDSNLSTFFHRSFEASLNEALLERDFVLNRKMVRTYLTTISEIPCSAFVDFAIYKMARDGLTTNDVPQFSDWRDGTDVICDRIREAGDSGFDHFAIGKLLRGLVAAEEMTKSQRFVIACRKYGEGHAKLAQSLGLLQECERLYFLSCIGQCWHELSDEFQKKLYTRFLLRTRFVRALLQRAALGSVSVKDLALQLGLSRWSVYRRHSNVVCLLRKLCSTDEYDFSLLVGRINTETMLERPDDLVGKLRLRRGTDGGLGFEK